MIEDWNEKDKTEEFNSIFSSLNCEGQKDALAILQALEFAQSGGSGREEAAVQGKKG